MKWKRKTTGFLAFLMAAFVGLYVAVVVPANAIRYQERVLNILVRGVLGIGPSAVIQLGTTVGGPNGTLLMKTHNKSGTDIVAGDFLVWDNDTTIVVATAVVGYTDATIAASLSTETANGGKFSLVTEAMGTVAADTMFIRGLDGNGVRQTLRYALTDGATTKSWAKSGTTRYYWTQIDSVSAEAVDGADSVRVYAYGYATVMQSDGANTDFAGVCHSDSLKDNNVGFVCVYGPIDGVVDAGSNDASPGVLLELASGGDAVVDTSPSTAQNVARCMEFSNADNQTIRVFVNDP